MEINSSPERTVIQYVRSSRAFRQFKNPPQPHMCIQDTIKDTTDKLFINVLGWQKIANPKHFADPIPLYGGMQIPQGCGPNSNKPPLIVFAVMVNPDILKANGKNATNPADRDALVSLLCDFVEAMNPGLVLARNPIILKNKDLAGELKDVWLAVQKKREKEKEITQDIMYKVYDIDGIGDDINEENKSNGHRNGKEQNGSPEKKQNYERKSVIKSSKQILMNAGQESEFDSGMNNCQINQNITNRDNRSANAADTTYCTPVYGQIVSTRENHNQINEIQQKFSMSETTKPSTSFRKAWNTVRGKTTEDWDEFSKHNISTIQCSEGDTPRQWHRSESNKQTISKPSYNFFPVFNNKSDNIASNDKNKVTNVDVKNDNNQVIDTDVKNDDTSAIIMDPMQKLALHSTDNNICDNKSSALDSLSS